MGSSAVVEGDAEALDGSGSGSGVGSASTLIGAAASAFVGCVGVGDASVFTADDADEGRSMTIGAGSDESDGGFESCKTRAMCCQEVFIRFLKRTVDAAAGLAAAAAAAVC